MTCDDIWHHLKVRKLQKSRNGYIHINIVSRFFHTVIINNYICFLYFSVCRLMVTEIQRKLKIFGTVKTFTKEGRPVYYKELVVSHILREPNSIIVLFFICIYMGLRVNACIVNKTIPSRKQFSISCINWCDVIRSYNCFQYTTKVRHSIVYVFSIFYGDVSNTKFWQLPNGYEDLINNS